MDEFLLKCDFQERHELYMEGSPESAYRAFEELDLQKSKILQVLLFLRGIRSTRSMWALFTPLLIQQPTRHVEGIIAKPWTFSGGIRKVAPEEFEGFDEPGFAKVVWEFTFDKMGDGCLVATETRIRCTDASSRRKFSLYWFFIRPFSGLVRRIILRMIRDAL